LRAILAAIIAVLALVGGSAVSAQGVAARFETQTFAMNASETRAAERRQANSELIRLRAIIDERQAQIDDLKRSLSVAGGTNRALRNQLEALLRQSADEKERYTAELARRDSEYARERAMLLSAGETWSSTPEGLEILRAFNAGDRARSLALARDLTQRRVELERQRSAIQIAAELRAEAVLNAQARGFGDVGIDTVIERWEAVVATGQAQHWDWVELARLYRENNRLDRAMRAAEQALATAQNQRDEAVGLNELGDMLAAMNRTEEALASYRRSLAIAESLAAIPGASAQAQRDVSVSLNKVGDLLAAMNRTEEALASYRRSLAMRETLAAIPGASAQAQRDVSVSLDNVGDLLAAMNLTEEALAS
jgi:tetratricopeptide (TPR) repeat protein